MARLVDHRRGRSAIIERIEKRGGDFSDSVYELISKLPSGTRADLLQELAKLYNPACGHRREDCECEETEESTGYHYESTGYHYDDE